jgi:hypothetical protein
VRFAEPGVPFGKPFLVEVDLVVDQRVTCLGGPDRPGGDLRVLHSSGGAGVLPGGPERGPAFLEVTRFVEDQDPVAAEGGHGLGRDDPAQVAFVPDRAFEEELEPVGAGVSCVFGDGPAVLARQLGEQAGQVVPGVEPGGGLREERGHRIEHPSAARGEALLDYSGLSDRLRLSLSHNEDHAQAVVSGCARIPSTTTKPRLHYQQRSHFTAGVLDLRIAA